MSTDEKKEGSSSDSLKSAFQIEKFEEHFGSKFEEKRVDLVYMARTAESAERYEDMCKCMRKLVEECNTAETDLTVEERNLLSVAYKNVIGARRASYRTLNAENDSKTQIIVDLYKEQVEDELDQICRDVLDLLENKLISENIENQFSPEAIEDREAANEDASKLSCVEDGSAEAQVFYLKMAGDYYRYLAEGTIDKMGENNSESDPDNKGSAADLYGRAFCIAEEALEATHPIRLGLALNFSVCYYEILKDKKKACALAKKAFDTAISKLDSLQEADYKDSTLIMQLLRDNLTLWTSSQEDEDVDPDPEGGYQNATEQVE